jgi:hypothetical protein
MTFNDFKTFFSSNLKWVYRDKCDAVLKRQFTKIGKYRFCEKNQKYGVLDEDGRWGFENTINTNSRCALELYNIYLQFGNDKLDFFDNTEYSVNKLWNFIEENFELLFTYNIEIKYYHKFRLICNLSWSRGQITSVLFYLTHKNIFPNTIKTTLELERGLFLDLKGVDGLLTQKDGTDLTLQIKSGSFEKKKSFYIINGAQNDFNSTANYYCYINVGEEKNQIIVFENKKENIMSNGSQCIIDEEIVKYVDMENKENISQKLMEILLFCSKNEFVFELKNNEPENGFKIDVEPEKVVTISIKDFEDQEFFNLLEENFNKLKNLPQ